MVPASMTPLPSPGNTEASDCDSKALRTLDALVSMGEFPEDDWDPDVAEASAEWPEARAMAPPSMSDLRCLVRVVFIGAA